MTIGPTLLYAMLGGILPALLWLWFFLKEDSKRPEPRWLIVAAFLAGMLAVVLALPTEMLAKCVAAGTWPESFLTRPFASLSYCRTLPDVNPVFLWAAVEELLKYGVAVAVVLWRRAVDEPIDAMVYLICVALGFAALETGLFLMDPLSRGDVAGGIITGNLRFMGAALIHTISSAAVGYAIAATYYKGYLAQFISLCTGLIAAIVLHALFNHHIIANSGERMAIVFFMVWLGVIGLLLLFERAKRITRPQQYS